MQQNPKDPKSRLNFLYAQYYFAFIYFDSGVKCDLDTCKICKIHPKNWKCNLNKGSEIWINTRSCKKRKEKKRGVPKTEEWKLPQTSLFLFRLSLSGILSCGHLVYNWAVRNPGPVVHVGCEWIVLDFPQNWSDVRFLIHRLRVSERHSFWIHVLHHLCTETHALAVGYGTQQMTFIYIYPTVKNY